MTAVTPKQELEVGQRWQHKRENWRQVVITHLSDGENWRDGVVRVYVSRTTSRRTQAISETTLRRHYLLVAHG